MDQMERVFADAFSACPAAAGDLSTLNSSARCAMCSTTREAWFVRGWSTRWRPHTAWRRPPPQELAVALEYFHTASLLFDDLPCMDNASERRGAPCAHLVFGEAGAILAALALINRAYALTWRAVSGCSASTSGAGAGLSSSGASAWKDCSTGRASICTTPRCPKPARQPRRSRAAKTVSLIRLTLALPAMLGGASERELQLLERIHSTGGSAIRWWTT